jgi:hypothetical protein
VTPTAHQRPSRPYRLARLSRGWEPVQLIGRLKLAARCDGVQLPKTWLLVRAVFLWENGRAPVPAYYATLLDRVLDPRAPRRGPAGRTVR